MHRISVPTQEFRLKPMLEIMARRDWLYLLQWHPEWAFTGEGITKAILKNAPSLIHMMRVCGWVVETDPYTDTPTHLSCDLTPWLLFSTVMYAIGPYVEGNLVLNLTRDGNPWGYLLFDGPLVYHLPDSTYLPSPTYCIIPTEVDSRGHPLVSASPTRLTYDPPAPARRNSVDDDD